MLDFLTRSKATDISARDFLEPTWRPPKSDAVKLLNGLRDTINKRLSHLTWERVAAPHHNEELDTYSIACAAVEVFADFVGALQHKSELLARKFEGQLVLAHRALGLPWPTIVPKPNPSSPLYGQLPKMLHPGVTTIASTTSSAGTLVMPEE